MLKTSLSLAVIVLLAYTAQAAPVSWYVSKSGNNSNAGTSTNAAFLTIQKAASVMNAGDTCYILSGTYRETVIPAHSGTSSLPITFTAYPGATPIVSGADLLNVSWSVYSNSIYQASTTSSFRQLFVDGVMMNEARWPNATVNNLLYAPRSTPTSVTLTNLTDTKLPSGLSLVGAYMHFFDSESSNPGYAASTRQITSWNPSNDTFAWSGNVYEADQTGCFYYLYGALSLLDISTEWYLDTTGQTLYLWTPDGASPANHVVEVKNRTSAFTLDNRSYVTVNGIYVFGAGISMANTTDCVVDNCNLIYVQHNTTADWQVNVPIADQVSGSGSIWENSTITYSSQDGIRCSGQNEIVSNCVIQQVDYYPGTYYACVTAYNGSGGTKVVNNTLWYSGRYCVGSSAPSVEIAYNDLGWGDLLTSDGGAEYVYVGAGNGAGTAIHNNWLHHSWAGLYIDALQNNYTAYRNVCYSNYNGLCFNWFTNNLIINNTSVSNTVDIFCNGTLDTNVSFINNIWHTKQTTFNTNTPLIDDGWFPPLGPNYVPLAGSGAIDGGMVDSPYTDGYVGAAPDIGAYEVGGTYWTPGANFTAQPFPNPYALPFVTAQPASQSNYIGQTATFTVTAVGLSPLHYQWQAGAAGSGGPYTDLIAGGQFSAVTNTTLTISNLTASNALDYVVVVTNLNGSIASTAATLTVLPEAPSIIVQPASQTNVFGQTATFTVTAAGVPPLSYQWCAGPAGSGVFTNLIAGGQFSAVTNSTLTISNLTLSNTADFVVVVTNASGSITSAPATLTVQTNSSSYKSTILADHPVSYWPLNETSGTVIHDVVGSNNGTCINTNGLTLGGQGILYGKGVTTDTAIYFTAANSGYINVPYSSTLNTSQFTIEAWLNMPTFPGGATNVNMNPLSLNNASPTSGWAFEIPSPNGSNPKMYGWLAYNAWTQVNSGTCIQSKWAYYALTYNGTTFCIYTNGVLAGSSTSSYSQVSSGHPLYLGAYNDSGTADRFYLGGMENVAFYSNALSAGHISSHYQVGSTGLPVAPTMSIQKSGSNAIVSWTLGSLQEATNANGPWTALTNAISPYTVGMTNSALFLRAGY